MVKEDVEAFRSNPFVGPGLQQVTWQVCSHLLNKALRNRCVKRSGTDALPPAGNVSSNLSASSRTCCSYQNALLVIHIKIFLRIIPAFFCLAHSALAVATNLTTHSGFASNCYLNHWARECLYNLWDSYSSEVDEQVAADAMMSHLLRSLTHLLLHSKGPKAVV